MIYILIKLENKYKHITTSIITTNIINNSNYSN